MRKCLATQPESSQFKNQLNAPGTDGEGVGSGSISFAGRAGRDGSAVFGVRVPCLLGDVDIAACAGGRGAIGETRENSLPSSSPDDDEEIEGEGGSCSAAAGAVAPRGGEVATAATLFCGTGVAGLSALVP